METTLGYKLANRRETLPTINDLWEEESLTSTVGGYWNTIPVIPVDLKVNEYPCIQAECISRKRYKIKHR